MFKILILVCSTALSREACTPSSADSVTVGPADVGLMECGLWGQAQLARTALRPEPGKQWLKVACVPAREVATAR